MMDETTLAHYRMLADSLLGSAFPNGDDRIAASVDEAEKGGAR